ncbi:hypothetical protein BMS3Abin07_00432 [bacterium BMS3Abin07]|nr:hypothetical protein BMS3Abin07_00432 [bacterium BMS3Abin07]GBE32757.1 hypothetical protein BMS3Bbin05_01676 [bacterium BMS3Bbin05]HDO22392.1 flippase-like domain-containing protein [Nitrospirota bacterium]HDZ88008.1 flippase-like domain-containing protein [Nitrospirota bacterium]
MEHKAGKKLFYFAIKFVVSGLFLYVVFRKAGVANIFSHLTTIRPAFFIFSVVLYIIATFISAIRWKMLLDEDYPLGKLFSLYMIGSFFNNILPGIIGGDAVKVYYLYSDTGKGGSSLGSVFMDRYLGFFALLLIGLVAGFFAYADLKVIGMSLAMPALFVFFILVSLVLFGFRLGKRFGAVSAFYDYFHYYIRKGSIMLKTVALSFIIQILSIVMVYVIALGLGESPSFLLLLVFMPIIITAATVPVSISGLGIREGAFVILLGRVGFSPQVAISISFLWFLSTVVASSIGLFEFLRYRKKALN